MWTTRSDSGEAIHWGSAAGISSDVAVSFERIKLSIELLNQLKLA